MANLSLIARAVADMAVVSKAMDGMTIVARAMNGMTVVGRAMAGMSVVARRVVAPQCCGSQLGAAHTKLPGAPPACNQRSSNLEGHCCTSSFLLRS